MSMLLPTTTITVRRHGADVDPYDAAEPAVVARSIPAHVGGPTGADVLSIGNSEVIDARLHLDITPVLTGRDEVTDEGTGEAYRIVWVQRRRGLGLDHQVAGLRSVRGASG